MGNRTKNILRNIGFLLSVPVIIGAFVFAVNIDKKETIKGIEVFVQNPELEFVSERDIKNTLMSSDVILNHSIGSELDLASLEEKVNSNPWVEEAEVYITSNKNVKVNFKQLEPKLRVQRTDSTANGYYLDDKGFMIPLSRAFYPDVPILTSERPITTIQQRRELVKLAQYIEADTFWQATISQINLDKNNDIELVSLIGDANIRFGSIDNMENKFLRIFEFYKKGINRINWDNVKELDVRFDKQVVCRRYHKEKHIEESRAPQLYKKPKTQAVALQPKKVEKPRIADVPKSKKAEPINKQSAPAVGKKTIAKKVEHPKPKKLASAEKLNTKTVVSKPNDKIEKPAASNKVKETVAKPIPTKRKKRKEIIINTEPVKTKNATQ